MDCIASSDPFDPNTWTFPPCRVYLDAQCEIFALVSSEDAAWAAQWRWCWRLSRGNLYARRAVGENANGLRLRTTTVYLHVEIQKRKGIRPPTKRHVIVDHEDGKTLNCTRPNLRWTTPAGNTQAYYRLARAAGDLLQDAGEH